MTTRQRRLAVFAGLNILLVVVGWMVLISPQRTDAASAAAKEQLVQNELAALTSGSSKTPTTKQPAIHTADLYALDTALPSQIDQPELLFELDRLASASDVKILNLTPQAPAAGNNYTIEPINLSLTGTYFHLTGFLKSLRLLVSEHQGHLIANGPLFAVTSVSIAPGTSSDKTAKGEVATVGMAAYYYGMVGGATAPAPTDTTTTSTTGS
jgi:hypothetical protein